MRLAVYLLVTSLICLALPRAGLADVSGMVRVVDGDTLDIDGTRVRLFGIDAPEKDQTCTAATGAVWDCGAWVSTVVRARYHGANARCVQKDTDRYGRVVATCFVEGADMARALVADGLAFAYRKYALDYDLDEKGAAIRGVGLHGSELQSPAAFRQGRVGEASEPSGCRIKGNISAKGTRIYHSPGQRDYEKTRISPAKGERWFCTAADAEAAGWRAARR
ncbi:MAG: thermonuclease family protein [Pseudomonadota bacterium]